MNVFSNIGITELILILLLALIVVGPERLPELAQRMGKTLRDVRKMYENLASDLGPELMSLQQTTQELRDSVESVSSIPKDMVQQVVDAAELDETVGELKGVTDSVGQMGQALSDAKRVVQDPLTAAADSVRGSLAPTESIEDEGVEDQGSEDQEPKEEPTAMAREVEAEKPEEASAVGETQAKKDVGKEEPGPKEQETEIEPQEEAQEATPGSEPTDQGAVNESGAVQPGADGEPSSNGPAFAESEAAEREDE